MTRRTAREIAFHLLYERCFQSDQQLAEFLEENLASEALALLAGEYDPYGEAMEEKDREYICRVVSGVEENKETLDERIARYAENWSAKRISKISFTILRLALYETEHLDDVPEAAAINEAVELAKKYESEDAGSFVNGILGAMSRGEKE